MTVKNTENVGVRLQKIRVALLEHNLKKSGLNKFQGYKYYELGDFLPIVNKMLLEAGLFSVLTMQPPTLSITDGQETLTFQAPWATFYNATKD
jgi:hypothetical protein